jgi:hypothetical protein
VIWVIEYLYEAYDAHGQPYAVWMPVGGTYYESRAKGRAALREVRADAHALDRHRLAQYWGEGSRVGRISRGAETNVA